MDLYPTSLMWNVGSEPVFSTTQESGTEQTEARIRCVSDIFESFCTYMKRLNLIIDRQMVPQGSIVVEVGCGSNGSRSPSYLSPSSTYREDCDGSLLSRECPLNNVKSCLK